MAKNWSEVLDKYVHKLVSPDGRQTYESKVELVNLVIELMELKKTDIVLDIGCGWGNFLNECSNFSDRVIGIEPNDANLKVAQSRNKSKSTTYIRGRFENLNYHQKVNKVVSMLAFHQVPWQDKEKALNNVSSLLVKEGYFFLCDTMILFDPKNNPELFDEVYRYLLKETTPTDIYKKYIEPHLVDDEVYLVDDMRKNSPEDNWFYSIEELENWSKSAGLKLVQVIKLCPFFGITIFQKMA